MNSNPRPTLNDDIGTYAARYNLRHGTNYYDVRVFVIACSVLSTGDRVMMEKETPLRSNEKQVWHIPEIDLTELPDSTGVNASLKEIVLAFLRRIFLAQHGIVKFLVSEKGTHEEGQSPTLFIYVTVCYPTLPLVRFEKTLKYGLVQWAHFCDGYEGLLGGARDFDILDSAIRRVKLDDDASSCG